MCHWRVFYREQVKLLWIHQAIVNKALSAEIIRTDDVTIQIKCSRSSILQAKSVRFFSFNFQTKHNWLNIVFSFGFWTFTINNHQGFIGLYFSLIFRFLYRSTQASIFMHKHWWLLPGMVWSSRSPQKQNEPIKEKMKYLHIIFRGEMGGLK